MNIGSESATAKFKFALGPSDDNGFSLQVNTELGNLSGTYVGVGNAPKTNQWYYLDIPVKDLIDEDGDFGFEYDFSNPINGTVFTCGFSDATCSKYKQGSVDPETGMYSITINEKGSALAIDGVFLYKKNSSNGIESVEGEVTNTSNGCRYDLSGRLANPSSKGVVIVKTAKGVKKVAIGR